MSPEQEVLAAESARAAALVRGDAAALALQLDDDLVYVHATGVRHDRAQFLDFVRSGPQFHEVRIQALTLRVHGDAALVSGDLYLRLQRPGTAAVEARSLVTATWLRRDTGWKLAAFQSTRPA